ncbi:hypothetical protein [Oceanisphaera sp.]|uniref:hypothetical protein n=1 Tax=Oceanisphaera sp. TaxID=1929979 RepID=UPI003A94F874
MELKDFAASNTVGGVPTAGTLDYIYTLTAEQTHSGANDDALALDIPLSVTDAGNATTDGTLTVRVEDDAPSVGTPEGATVYEAGLPNGRQWGNDEQPDTVVTGDLAVRLGADTIGADIQFSEDLLTDNSELMKLGLNSGYNGDGSEISLQYVISDDKHTLIAYKGAGRDPAGEVFTVTINDPNSSDASYTFTLKGSLNHESGTKLDLPFAFEVTDGDGDTDSGSFVVEVVDDMAKDKITIITKEDESVTFTTSADARADEIEILATKNEKAIAADDLGRYEVAHGYVTIGADGTVTYKPYDNYSNHGKPDTFFVTVTEDNGDPVKMEVTVNVTPVADAPDIPHANVTGDDVTAVTVNTNEDTAVALGLKTPVITDNTDQNGRPATDNGDNPERLGAITLALEPRAPNDTIPDDTILTKDDGAPLRLNGGSYIIVIVDENGDADTDLHVSDLPVGDAGINYLTRAEYEAIKAQPAEDRHENFDVVVSVDSYEVNSSGTKLPDRAVAGTNGANSKQIITVDVQAVTDAPEIALTAPDDPASVGATNISVTAASSGNNGKITVTMDEDGMLDLQKVLEETLKDTDGSESYWYGITGLPKGTVVSINGKSYTASEDGKITMPSVDQMSTKDIGNPAFTITPPAGYSSNGPLNAAITLTTKDSDDDSTVDIIEQSVTVDLVLQVNPVAGDVTAGNVTTKEDTSVNFLKHVTVTDKGTGNEEINKIVFEVPDNWVVGKSSVSNEATWSANLTDSTYTIEFTGGPEADREAVLKGFTITPPAHSSVDATIRLKVTTTDTNGSESNKVVDKPLDVKVTVTPVAERTDTDSNVSGSNDVTMTGGHTYTTKGLEDEWFTLGQEGDFKLGEDWRNEDASEKTYARLTPEQVGFAHQSQQGAIGAQFRYSTNGDTTEGGGDWKTLTYTGTPVDIPMEYLDTLQFKAPPNYAGEFKIKVEAKTVDYDADHPGDLSKADIQISGEKTLTNIDIQQVSDEVTLAVNGRVSGDEDTGIPLQITPTSSDSSETFNVTIDAIPGAASLTYGSTTLSKDATGLPGGFTITTNDDGSWKVQIENFDSSEKLKVFPLKHSNHNFTLNVSAQTQDGDSAPGPLGSLSIKVNVRGDADDAGITLTPKSYSEADLDGRTATAPATNTNSVKLTDLVTIELTDTDGSESLTVRVTGLPEGFSPSQGAMIASGTGAERVWVMTQTQYEAATISVPKNYSGTVKFQVAAVTTENDGDSKTGAEQDVSFTVTPSAEATVTTSATLVEDEVTSLGFKIVHQKGDTDETLGNVWVKVADAGTGDATFTLYLGTGADAVTLADAKTNGSVSIESLGGVDYYKLTADQAKQLAAKGAANLDGGLGAFEFKYEIIDEYYGDKKAVDVNGQPIKGTEVFDGLFTLTATPVTDEVTVSINEMTPDAGTLSQDENSSYELKGNAKTLTVNLNINSEDIDGSEKVIRIQIDGVPEGMTVKGAEQTGETSWLLSYEGDKLLSIDDAQGIKVPVVFEIAKNVDKDAKSTITMTVQTQDRAEQESSGTEIESGKVSWVLGFHEEFVGGAGDPPEAASIDTWEYKQVVAEEDESFSLSEVITGAVEVKSTGVVNTFTITLSGVPEGTTFNGMYSTMVNGEKIWTANVTTTEKDGTAALQGLLDRIKVTPPEHSNENNNPGGFSFSAILTASVQGGYSNAATIEKVLVPVAPVTDEASLMVEVENPSEISEGADSIPLKVSVDTGVDGTDGKIVDGQLYLQLDPADPGGLLIHNDLTLSLTNVAGVAGVQEGDYYVIDVGASGGEFILTYKPTKVSAGTLAFKAYVQTREDDAQGLPDGAPQTQIVTKETSAQVTVHISNEGVEVTTDDISGNEAGESDQAQAIKLTKDKFNVVLKDTDGSEKVDFILLSNLPEGFLVFTGVDAASATLAGNAGGSGGLNSWIISGIDGNLPPYVAILPPAHWSGTLSGLQLTVSSGEEKLSAKKTETFDLGDVIIKPVANGIDIVPTVGFGVENDTIALNLNAAMVDSRDASVGEGIGKATDTSQETASIRLMGLGEHAAFYLDGKLISGTDQVTYDSVKGTYTLSGLAQDDLAKLRFKQAKSALDDQGDTKETLQIGVEAWTQDGEAVSEVTKGFMTVNVSKQLPTTGDDTLLWTGDKINGGLGQDTIQLRFGESRSGDELAAKLKNIEMIDLRGLGKDSITGLTVKHVFDMTDDRNTLLIFHDQGQDTIQLDASWTLQDNSHTYKGIIDGKTVTLKLSNQQPTDVNDTLLWTGEAINGGLGQDTIQLLFGETVSGNELAEQLDNIEVIDLSITGANKITDLTAEHVLKMTDGRNTLKIIGGQGEDTIALDGTWQQQDNGNIYKGTVNGTEVTLELSNHKPTGGDDTLLWTGKCINGLGGEDTIQLRFGENLSGAELFGKLRNIEVLDLRVAGANRIGNPILDNADPSDDNGSLSVDDVISMTDDKNVLSIFGDSEDSVTLSADWSLDEDTSNTEYIIYNGANNTELKIYLSQDQIYQEDPVIIE